MDKKRAAIQKLAVLFSVVFAAFTAFGAVSSTFAPNIPFLAQAAAAEQRSVASATVRAETGYYTDADGDWIHNPGLLERGLRYFY